MHGSYKEMQAKIHTQSNSFNLEVWGGGSTRAQAHMYTCMGKNVAVSHLSSSTMPGCAHAPHHNDALTSETADQHLS